VECLEVIDQATLLTYVAVLTGFVFIPGPAVLLTLARAASSGTRVGIATGLGIAAGDLAHTVMAVFGLSAVLAASAILFNVIKYLGAAYLVYLGIRAILDRVDSMSPATAAPITPPKAFRQAVLAEILNPKSALFFLAFLPQFVQPQNGAVPLQLATLGVLFVVMGAVSTMIFAVGAGGIGHFLRRNPVVVRWQRRVVGTIYCALGVRLALQER
jgi:threonine/homoserine/homoserine lactone efflux protein